MARAPDQMFEAILESELQKPETSVGRMFGSPGLRVAGKVYAMLVKGRFVVKPPADRVDALVALRPLAPRGDR